MRLLVVALHRTRRVSNEPDLSIEGDGPVVVGTDPEVQTDAASLVCPWGLVDVPTPQDAPDLAVTPFLRPELQPHLVVLRELPIEPGEYFGRAMWRGYADGGQIGGFGVSP